MLQKIHLVSCVIQDSKYNSTFGLNGYLTDSMPLTKTFSRKINYIQL